MLSFCGHPSQLREKSFSPFPLLERVPASSDIKASSDGYDALMESAFVVRFAVSVITRTMRARSDISMDCMLRLMPEPDTGVERQKADELGCCLGTI